MASMMVKWIEQEIPRLRRFARCLVRDADLADDMVQRCLLRALDEFHTWPSDGNPRASLLAILHECHVDEAHRAARPPLVTRAEPGAGLPGTLNGRGSPETLAAIRDAFMRLQEEHREILLLVVVEELDYGQAADVLGIPVATVASRLSCAREALRGASGIASILPVAHSVG